MLCPKNIKGETCATGNKNFTARPASRAFMTNYSTGGAPTRKDARDLKRGGALANCAEANL
jgi:hypothetical protein